MTKELSDIQCAMILYEWLKQGEQARDNGETEHRFSNNIHQMMHSYGWVKRDLQLGLAVYSDRYAKTQPDITVELMRHWVETTDVKPK